MRKSGANRRSRRKHLRVYTDDAGEEHLLLGGGFRRDYGNAEGKIAALRAAGLPQSEVLDQLEAELAQGKRQIQELTDLGSQCQAALEQAEHTLHLAERMEFVQTVSSIYTLQDAAQLTIQRQQEVAQRLQELTAGLEAAQARLNALLDDLLSQGICQ